MKARGTALSPFVPSGADFALSLAFFNELGFETRWETDGLAGLRYDDAYFMLQNIDVPVWQQNQMITYEVDDLDTYWAEIEALRLPDRYAGVKLKVPTIYPWGREIHIIDPAGVCWHVRQSNRT